MKKQPNAERAIERGSGNAPQPQLGGRQRSLKAGEDKNSQADGTKRSGGLEDALTSHRSFPPATRGESLSRFCQLTGMTTERGAELIFNQMMAIQVWQRGGGTRDEKALAAAEMLQEFAPANPTEALLCVQMFGVHEAATLLLKRATVEGQTFEGTDANVLRAARLMRLFNEQVELMARLKGKTPQQRVTVEHVHVHRGGQAIVGAVGRGEDRTGGGG
jgi:hypothetical protein